MNKITLNQIGLYNPQRMSDEAAESLFVVRKEQLGFLLGRLRKEKSGSIPQHHLVIAQRGMGKTTLLKRLEVELRKKDYALFIPLLFPEEQYNLKNLAEFWLNCLDALADTLEVERQEKEVRQIDEKVKVLMQIRDDEELAREAYRFFKEFSLSIGRRPVLLIDNMNLIFDRLEKPEQHTLRAWITQNDAPVIIGASSSPVEDTVDYGAPFYDAFQIHYLKKLNFDELVAILLNLAELTEAEGIMAAIRSELPRLKTLHQLTGGNPRTAVMLFRLIVKGFSQEINDDLEGLLDEATPLYKARFEELSTQMQVIVDAIALHWDPINLEQLRSATRYENGQLSPQLKRLLEMGWIDKADAYQAKGSAYQISERFFNIWFLMRRSSRRQKKEIYCLSKFLESFYGDDVQILAKNRLCSESTCLDHVAYSLALAEVVKDDELKMQLQEKSFNELCLFAQGNPKIFQQFEIPSRFLKKELAKIWEQFNLEMENKNYLKANNLLLRSIEFNADDVEFNAIVYILLGMNWDLLNDPAHAEEAYKQSIALNDKDPQVWELLGRLYYFMAKYAAAEEAYKQSINLDDKNPQVWVSLGRLYYSMEKYVEAEEACKQSIALNDKDPLVWWVLGGLYDSMEKYAAAEEAYKQSIALNDKDPLVWGMLGCLYYSMEKYAAAEEAYKQSIALNDKDSQLWRLLGRLYGSMEKYAAAEEAYKQSIALDDKDPLVWRLLGRLYHSIEKYAAAEEAYKQSIDLDDKNPLVWELLGGLYYSMEEYVAAEKAYKQSIALNDKDPLVWVLLGGLYDSMEKYVAAEEAYKQSISLDDKDPQVWEFLGRLYHYSLEKYAVSEEAYKQSIALDDKNSTVWNLLGNLYLDYLEEYAKAEVAFKKAIELDEGDLYSKYNLIFLYRDKFGRIQEAEDLFNTLALDEDLEDSYWLNKALFELYRRNEGIAGKYAANALQVIQSELPTSTQDDWWRFGAVVTRLGYGNWLLSILEEKGYDVILAPYFVALKAINVKDTEAYLNSKAVEVRTPARKLIEVMKKYM